MNILCVGDVVGSAGCEYLREKLPLIKRQYNIDLTVVNGENSADGNGILPTSAEHIFVSGADVITGGNHTFRRREIYPYLEENAFVLRPSNYPDCAPGGGYALIDLGRTKVAVINLLGVVFMEPLDDPFRAADRLIKRANSDGAGAIVVDIHAEATAEKKALAYYLDGRVSAVFGTHTHVQTADEQILPNGTGFITDVGMTGPYNSVLGVKPELAVEKMKDKLPVRFMTAGGANQLNACVFTIDNDGKCTKSVRVSLI